MILDYISPLVHGSPSPGHPLEDNPLAVPDRGHVADGVEAAAVRVTRPSHIDNSEQDLFNILSQSLCSKLTLLLHRVRSSPARIAVMSLSTWHDKMNITVLNILGRC